MSSINEVPVEMTATSSPTEMKNNERVITEKEYRKNLILGSLCVAFGSFLFATNDAIFKLSGYKESELLTGRFMVQWILAILWWICKKPPNVTNWYGDDPYIINTWVRGTLYIIHIFTLWYAMALLPIGDANCILYQSPLLIVFLASIWLKEKLPKLYILIPTTISCIMGIILISQPQFIVSLFSEQNDGDQLNGYGLIAITISMISWSFVNLLVRTALKSHFLQLEMVSSLQVSFLGIPLLIFINHMFVHDDAIIGDLFSSNDGWNLDLTSFALMGFLGTSGFIALLCMVVGYQYGDATKVPWLEYTNVITSMLYQAIIFKDIPNIYETIGCLLVIIASIVPLIHELYGMKKNDQYEQVQNIGSSDDEYITEIS
eukprot:142398_1